MTNWNQNRPTEFSAKEFYTRSFWVPIRDLTWTWALIIGTMSLVSYLNHPLMSVSGFILIGIFQYRLNILGHDGIHYLLFNSRRANDLICRIFLHGPQLAPLTILRRNHLNHHRALGSEEDGDRQYYRVEDLTPHFLTIRLVGSLLGGMVLPIFWKLITGPSVKQRKTEKEKVASALDRDFVYDLITVGLSQLTIAAMLLLVTGSIWSYFTFWVLPLFTVMTGLNTIRSTLEHADPQNGCRVMTFQGPWIERQILSPLNMNYHREHHWFMTVPYYQLPGLHRSLGIEIPRVSYFGRLMELRRALRDHQTKVVEA